MAMRITPKIFTAQVMHKRLFPKINDFSYNVYYIVLPLSQIHSKSLQDHLTVNKPALLSFHEKDHATSDNKHKNEDWIMGILQEHGLNYALEDIMLVTMPRILGYVFNPVSFWFMFDKEKNIRTVLCEVNNTFGETHNYLCSKKNGDIIEKDDWLEAEKLFHVSPFLKREGKYKFRFSLQNNNLGIWINFHDGDNQLQLITSLIGHLKPLNKANLRYVFITHPLLTFKVIFLIHWQAIKLLAKGMTYISKPRQFINKLSKTK